MWFIKTGRVSQKDVLFSELEIFRCRVVVRVNGASASLQRWNVMWRHPTGCCGVLSNRGNLTFLLDDFVTLHEFRLFRNER